MAFVFFIDPWARCARTHGGDSPSKQRCPLPALSETVGLPAVLSLAWRFVFRDWLEYRMTKRFRNDNEHHYTNTVLNKLVRRNVWCDWSSSKDAKFSRFLFLKPATEGEVHLQAKLLGFSICNQWVSWPAIFFWTLWNSQFQYYFSLLQSCGV